jgi:phospholipid/cholesterol/gamma-HCH transport system permease protein
MRWGKTRRMSIDPDHLFLGSDPGDSPPACTETVAPASSVLARWLAALSTSPAVGPFRALGGFFAMALDTLVLTFKPPFAWREYLHQAWFVARVSLAPAMMMTVPYAVLFVFVLNILLIEFGAADLSGTAAALGAVTQIGPAVTVLVISGAGATAMCADLGARTIREELDALRVMGINPIQTLVVPRVLAATTVSLALASTVIMVGLTGAYLFAVFAQHVSAGAFVAGLTTLTGAKDVVIALTKATVFGGTAGLIACYRGITVAGGPAGVGNAVNETVVIAFMALFAINSLMTAVGVQATL